MKPAPFDYHRPEHLEDALRLLTDLGPEARPLAGGQSLLPFMNFRLARPTALVDLNRVDGLAGVSESEGTLTIGAMTRQWDAQHSPVVARHSPMLAEALRWVGHTATRTRGTIGGSLAHADPAAELPTVAVALGAEMLVDIAAGSSRTLPANEFFVDHYTTALDTGELLVGMTIPKLPATTLWAFDEFSFRSGDFAVASVAMTLERRNRGIASAGVTLGGVGSKPVHASAAEEILADGTPSSELWKLAGEAAADEIDPIDDEVPSGYRRQIVAKLVEDTAAAAWRSGDETDD